jgi:hypothetical protein
MKATETIKGQISKGLKGLGTVTPDMVEQRAKEIALINGRAAEDFNKADLEEAHAELTGKMALEEQQEEEPTPAVGTLRDIVPGTAGHKNAPKLPSDDQRVAEQLVQEGVDEAEHHSMLVGSTQDTEQNS